MASINEILSRDRISNGKRERECEREKENVWFYAIFHLKLALVNFYATHVPGIGIGIYVYNIMLYTIDKLTNRFCQSF